MAASTDTGQDLERVQVRHAYEEVNKEVHDLENSPCMARGRIE